MTAFSQPPTTIHAARLRRQPLAGYRYVRLRWRVLFAVVDALGAILFRLGRWMGRLAHGVDRRAAWPDPRRILLVQLDHLGDAVLSAGMLAALRRRWPEAALEVLASRANRELFAAMPEVDRVHVCHGNRFARSGSGRWIWPLAILAWAWRLRLRQVDLAIDVRGDFPVALLLWLCGAQRRVGWACGGGGFLLTDITPYVPGRAEAASRWALLRPLGIAPTTTERTGPTFRPSAAARQRVVAVLDRELGEPSDSRPLVAVHLGAGTPAKQWPLEHWTRLIHWLHTQARARVVLIGAPEDRARAAAIVAHDPPGVLNWTGRCGIEGLAALLEQTQLMIGADSGPAHLAAAVGTPVVVLFSGTNEVQQWRPEGAAVRVLRAAAPCSPCHREVCPVVGHPCMRSLSPMSVAEAVQPLLPPAACGDLLSGVAP